MHTTKKSQLAAMKYLADKKPKQYRLTRFREYSRFTFTLEVVKYYFRSNYYYRDYHSVELLFRKLT